MLLQRLLPLRTLWHIVRAAPGMQQCRYSSSDSEKTGVKQLFFRDSSKCAAVMSTSLSIFENLAFEDWLYDNITLQEDERLMLLWRNLPAVVIGKFQNPWVECCISQAIADGVAVCRRKSGGGAVYHDTGNINCSFFTHRARYHRKTNLGVIVEALKSQWNLDVAINNRDDIVLNGSYKVSGTAAKLGRSVAYHHCTLLVEADGHALGRYLSPTFSDEVSLDCSATRSTRASTLNLKDVCSSITCEQAMHAIVRSHMQRFTAPQQHEGVTPLWTSVNPADTVLFPEVQQRARDFRSWDWTYGKTPEFNLRLPIECGINAELHLVIRNGIIDEVAGQNVDTDLATLLGAGLRGLPLCATAMEDCQYAQQHQRFAAASKSSHEPAVKDVLDRLLRAFRRTTVHAAS